MVRDEILAYFDIPAEKLHVIYSGVDTERFHPSLKAGRQKVRNTLGIPNDHSLFLFVGSGFERKGASVFIRALADLPNTAHGVIVGEDKHRKKYEALAERLGLNKQIHFLGKQSDVGPYYGAADAMVLPTLYDPFPNVILEAMACGLPVITSTKSGGSEFIQQDTNGYVVDSLDIANLSQHMKTLMNPELAESFGFRSRVFIEQFDLPTMSKNLTKLYDKVINDKHSKS